MKRMVLIGVGWLWSVVADAQVFFLVNVKRFWLPDTTPYVEIHYALQGKGLTYKRVNEGYVAHVSVRAAIFRQSDSVKVETLNFEWETPPVKDTSNMEAVWVYLQRVSLPPDRYWLEVSMKDKANENQKERRAVARFDLTLPDTFPYLGDPLWVDQALPSQNKDNRFFRNGYILLPAFTEGTYLNPDSIQVYFEIYGLNRYQEPLYLQVQMVDGLTRKVIEPTLRITSPRPRAFVSPYFYRVPADFLPSQTYLLEIFAKTNANEIKAHFEIPIYIYSHQEHQDYYGITYLYEQYFNYPEGELDEYLAAIRYIATADEERQLDLLRTFDEKKAFFVRFWERRRNSADAPIDEQWRDYYARIQYANRHFTSRLRKGWQTDRGRVLLKYGPPDDVQSFLTEINAHPYIIWTYNRLNNQSNVFFVFYDPDLATNEFPLLHSTLAGEVYNANWRLMVMRGKVPNYSYDPQVTDPGVFKDDKEFGAGTSGMPR